MRVVSEDKRDPSDPRPINEWNAEDTCTLKISVKGIVQGVGFRPFVYQLAHSLGLKGRVCNRSGDVLIEIEGPTPVLESFVERLRADAPPASCIDEVNVAAGVPVGFDTFEILESVDLPAEYQAVSPDLATCPDCRDELFDPADRRYSYPFTNCTNCGPRFTIIEDIPYDRPKTTMRDFQMCPDCESEYRDPLDRRFHAQPNACPVCGPQITLLDHAGAAVETDDVIGFAAKQLREGRILAVKGLGGFLLACDATNDSAVCELRSRKQRPAKPFAVMVQSIEDARKHARLSESEEKLLQSSAAPIVLVRWLKDGLAESVAPGQEYMGLMLPYTPLHHLIMAQAAMPLVMTSGNLSEEPIAKDNDEARQRLAGIADFFIIHNRDIYSRYDDSVVLHDGEGVQVVRRARGCAPRPVKLPYKSRQILACGAELKNTFCLTRDNNAFVSQHIGDLENIETFEAYEETIGLYKSLFKVDPETLAYDLHPEYLSTKYALEQAEKNGLRAIGVQHHHAHIMSCIVDNGLNPEEPVLGVSFDGTGFGSDGTLWGGEFLLSKASGFERLAHLSTAPLPGGALAIRNPYRTALGYLYTVYGDKTLLEEWASRFGVNQVELDLIRHQIERGLNCPITSSSGRLFDAVAAILGVCLRTSYEAEGAVGLEMLATPVIEQEINLRPYEWNIGGEGPMIVDLGPLVRSVVESIGAGEPKDIIAARFHLTAADIIADVSEILAKTTRLSKVALSGGVFQNRLLLGLARKRLREKGLEVIVHSQVPCNDGGVSLGQAVIAHYSSR